MRSPRISRIIFFIREDLRYSRITSLFLRPLRETSIPMLRLFVMFP